MDIRPIDVDYVACKVPTFSFARLKNSDPRLGVEMQSTGEVACFGQNQYEAFLKSWLASGLRLPAKNILLSIGGGFHGKKEFLDAAQRLTELGFQLYATKNTYDALKSLDNRQLDGLQFVYKPLGRREPNVLTLLQAGKIDLVINVPDSMDSQAATDGFELRRMAVDSATPLITNIKTATLCVQSLHRKWGREKKGRDFWSFASWQEYVEGLETQM